MYVCMYVRVVGPPDVGIYKHGTWCDISYLFSLAVGSGGIEDFTIDPNMSRTRNETWHDSQHTRYMYGSNDLNNIIN